MCSSGLSHHGEQETDSESKDLDLTADIDSNPDYHEVRAVTRMKLNRSKCQK